MARARSGGGMGVALVLFVIAFVFALVAAIIFASNSAKNAALAEEAQTRLRQVATDNELLTVVKPPDARGTLVGHLSEENQQLKQMISSQPETSAAVLSEQRQQMGVEQALFDEIRRLRNELSSLESRVQQAEAARDQAIAQAEAAEQSRAQLEESYNATIAELRGQIQQVSGDFQQYRESISGSDRKLADDLAALRREKDQQIAELEQQIRQYTSDLNRLQRELEIARGDQDLPTGENIIQADGQVTALTDSRDRVYISLGADSHVLLGTTFEVFGAGELIKADERNVVRGKATIEVIEVGQTTAQARVVRRGHQATLRPGDQIVNLVFDPQKTYRFHVFGDFDINYDGQATEPERLRVESMVRTWGGQLTDELTYETDYLVLGIEPPLPEPLPPSVIDPVLIQRNVEAENKYRQYQTLIGEARALGIPILNQNRFLALVGHYDR